MQIEITAVYLTSRLAHSFMLKIEAYLPQFSLLQGHDELSIFLRSSSTFANSSVE